jgi:hypothetical protein
MYQWQAEAAALPQTLHSDLGTGPVVAVEVRPFLNGNAQEYRGIIQLQ